MWVPLEMANKSLEASFLLHCALLKQISKARNRLYHSAHFVVKTYRLQNGVWLTSAVSYAGNCICGCAKFMRVQRGAADSGCDSQVDESCPRHGVPCRQKFRPDSSHSGNFKLLNGDAACHMLRHRHGVSVPYGHSVRQTSANVFGIGEAAAHSAQRLLAR